MRLLLIPLSNLFFILHLRQWARDFGFIQSPIVIPVDMPAWVLGEISVKVGKVGNPSWPLRVELHRVTSAPGDMENWNSVHLWSGEIDPSAVYETADWVSLAVNPVEVVDEETGKTVMQDIVIEPGAYGLMVRCPQLDTHNYYEVILEEPGTYDGKTFYVQDEATEEWITVEYHSNASDISVYDGVWRVHDVDVDLVFEMWGVLPIETQMKQMIETAWDGWTAVDVLLETEISTRQYREGTTTCKYELEKLLKLAGPDVVVEHTMDGAMIVRQAIAGIDGAGLTGTGYMLRDDGKLADGMGRPLDGCVLPAGQFVELPDSAKEIDGVLGHERFLVDKAEYIVAQDELILSPVGAVDPWDHWIDD